MVEQPSGRGLLDTSVVIGIDEVDGSRLPEQISVSALTLAELSAGPIAAGDDLERARRQDRLQRVEAGADALPFEFRCARAYGQVYAEAIGVGRKPRGARAFDLMIAATAMVHGLPLYTRNARDLLGLEGLVEIVDVSA